MSDTLLDQLQEHSLAHAFAPEVREEAEALITAGRVSRPRITSRRAAAFIADGRRGRCLAELQLGPHGVEATCACGRHGCAHLAALWLMVAGGAPAREVPEPAAGPQAPREQERARRAERARSGLFRVSPARGSREILGTYQVSSPSGSTYAVTLRALDAPHNSCSCQDFATNLLGTCKHIEAVLASLEVKRPKRRLLEAARAAGPRASYLHLAHDPATEVRLRRVGHDLHVARFARRWFDGEGRPLSPAAEGWPELLAEARRCGVEIPAEVERWTARALEEAARTRRREAIEAEVLRAGERQPGFAGRLYPYQVEGAAFLAARGRALLADDMGLGKTAQAIAAMARLLRNGEIARTLIVCPASLKHQWAQEIARFVALPGVGATVVGGNREQRQACYRHAREIVITSYELLRADERDIGKLAPDLLVLDEAQRIKNWRTRTADVVKRIPTRLAYVLTGTPLENRLDDLYSLMQVVDPHVLGPLWSFNQDFTQLDDRGRVQGYRNLGELRARLRPHLLRRRKEEVLQQLPERLVSRLEVALDGNQRSIHDEAEETVARLLAILRRRPLSPIEEQRLMRAFQRMRMACDAACLLGGDAGSSPKLEELERLLDEICVQGGHKVVVFSEWERMQELAAKIATRLKIGHVRLYGGVPSHRRGELIERFRADPACQIFFSTDAGGVGLNLQAADHLINLDLPWNPAVLAQRIARIHRLGQKNAVNVVVMVAQESIESRMELTLAAKRGLFEATVGTDVETDAIERTGLARRIATLLTESFAAPTGAPAPAAAPAEAPAPDPVTTLRQSVGEQGLEQIVRTREGRLVAVVGDGTPLPPAGAADAPLLLPAAAVQALSAFGEASPLSGAQVLFAREAPPADPEQARRRAQLEAAERKLRGAGALAGQGLGAEALGLLHGGLALLCRAAAERDPGEEPAALLGAVYGELVPKQAILAADAAALTRAGELARAFALAPVAPAEALVAQLAAEADALAARVRERMTRPASAAA